MHKAEGHSRSRLSRRSMSRAHVRMWVRSCKQRQGLPLKQDDVRAGIGGRGQAESVDAGDGGDSAPGLP